MTKTANKVLGIIKWSYEDKSMANLLPLYKALVRPHIEYCVQAWRPYYQKDVDNLEKIQRRANRMMEELREMEYEERLRQTRLVTLEARRTRADIIEVFKIMKGLEGGDIGEPGASCYNFHSKSIFHKYMQARDIF